MGIFERFKRTPTPLAEDELRKARGLPSTIPLSDKRISERLMRPLLPADSEKLAAKAAWDRARGLPSSAMLTDEQVTVISGVEKPEE